MKGTRAAIRYAKALLQQVDGDKAKSLVNDMEAVVATLENSKELRNALKSPIIKNEVKETSLIQIFDQQSEELKTLIKVLCQNQRANILGSVASSYIHLYNDAQGVKEAEVTTALPLSASMEKQVLAKVKELTGSDKVTLKNHIDETILGGFILRVGDMQYNASIANQLTNIKREFSKSL